jgi:CheY-like chemotaxis protein
METKTVNVNSVKTVPIVFPGKNIRVLVVEDNLINQLLVVKVLQQQGLVADVAENGKIALTKHIENKYDVILMDLQMPEMDGYEVTKSILNLGATKRNIPIIAMTAHTIKGELEHCLDAGMNEFISKPFNKEELLEKICSAVAVNTISFSSDNLKLHKPIRNIL